MYKRPTFRRLLLFFVAASLVLLAPQSLTAQATAAAEKKGDLSTFGMYSIVWPAWLGTTQTNNGFTFGLDYLRHVRLPVAPVIELRGKVSSGPKYNEHTWGGGIRVEPEQPLGAYHPYATFLISSGTIKFNQPVINYRGLPYTSDNSLVYSVGGGLDVDLTEKWTVRGDFQYEWWSIGTNQNFNPKALSIGIVYRIPFHPF